MKRRVPPAQVSDLVRAGTGNGILGVLKALAQEDLDHLTPSDAVARVGGDQLVERKLGAGEVPPVLQPALDEGAVQTVLAAK